MSFAMALFLVGIIFSSTMLLYGVRKKDKFSGFWGSAFWFLYLISFMLFQPVAFRTFNLYVKEDSIKFYDTKLKKDTDFLTSVITDRFVQIARDYYNSNSIYPEYEYLLNEATKDNMKQLYEGYDFNFSYVRDTIQIITKRTNEVGDTLRASLSQQTVSP